MLYKMVCPFPSISVCRSVTLTITSQRLSNKYGLPYLPDPTWYPYGTGKRHTFYILSCLYHMKQCFIILIIHLTLFICEGCHYTRSSIRRVARNIKIDITFPRELTDVCFHCYQFIANFLILYQTTLNYV